MASISVFGLLEKNGVGRPPVDILGLVAGLTGFAALSFWFAFLPQLSGAVVENGISHQTVATIQLGSVGIVLVVLAVFVYQRRPIGWYGTFAMALVVLIQVARIDIPFGSFLIGYITIPLIVITLLLVRRSLFFDGEE